MSKKLLTLLIAIVLISLLLAARTVYYQINPNRCFMCGRCVNHCPTGAIQFNEETFQLQIVPELCNGCGVCVQYCPYGAIYQVTANADDSAPPPGIALACHPNPFQSEIDLTAFLPEAKQGAKLTISDLKGHKIMTQNLGTAEHNFRWNGRNGQGRQMPSGIYLVQLSCGAEQVTKQITLVRK